MMYLKEALECYKGKKIVVLGLGVSNIPLVRILCGAGLDVTACDRMPEKDGAAIANELRNLGAKVRLGPDYLDGTEADVVFRTPVMLPTTPELKRFIDAGAVITSEMALFFEVCPCRIIAITGSDGKTTTTTLISRFLAEAGFRTFLGGNIGNPLLPEVERMGPDDFAVVELSSFQLMDMKPAPFVSVITNVSPNHLDKHTDMDEYITSKKNIYRYQSADSFTVLNLDNPVTFSMMEEIPGKCVTFSSTSPAADVYLNSGVICCGKEPLLERGEILLPGNYNVENYMAAIAAVKDVVSPKAIRNVARSFKGVEHRMELVRVKNGVSFYNDSIASSPNRSMAGLSAFSQKIIMIAGGHDKHVPFDALGPVICEKVKILILTGDTAPKIKAAVLSASVHSSSMPKIVEIDDFYEAVRAADRLAEPGDSVLLSPAGPAFDKFKNFAVRGNEFKRTVMNLE